MRALGLLLAIGAVTAAAVGYIAVTREAPDPPEPAADAPFIRAPSPLEKDVDTAERRTSLVVKAIRGGLLADLAARDFEKVATRFTDDFQARIADPQRGERIADQPVEIRRTVEPRTLHDRAETVAVLKALLGSIAAVERTSWRVFGAEVAAEAPVWTAQRAHLIIAGVDETGAKISLLATVAAEVVEVDGAQRLRRLALEEATWTRSSLPEFRDLSALVGVDWSLSAADEANVQGMIDLREMVATGGLTALDYNRDGFWDVLASHQAVGTVLFQNDGAGGFVKKTLPLIDTRGAAGKFYLWVDLDNDGAEELVSTKPALYTFAGGRMKQVEGALPFTLPEGMKAPDFEGLTACDVNGDQLLDLVFDGYGHETSALGFNNVDSSAGVPNLLFINQGGLRFVEEGRARGLAETRYTFVAECFDFDDDGDVDLFFGNDYGPNEYYENTGGGRFRADAEHPLRKGTSFSMGVSIADYDNTGELSISISNMYSHSGSRIVPLTSGLSEHMQGVLSRLAAGNTFYVRKAGGFEERADELGVAMGDWAWGNIFFDFDNDGDKDLYVVNGYTTHADPTAPDF